MSVPRNFGDEASTLNLGHFIHIVTNKTSGIKTIHHDSCEDNER